MTSTICYWLVQFEFSSQTVLSCFASGKAPLDPTQETKDKMSVNFMICVYYKD